MKNKWSEEQSNSVDEPQNSQLGFGFRFFPQIGDEKSDTKRFKIRKRQAELLVMDNVIN